MMGSIKKKLPGILTCFIIAVPSWLLGKTFPIIGGACDCDSRWHADYGGMEK